MESLALLAIIVLFTALIGGPVAFLLTYLPDQPKRLRVSRTIAVVILSLIGLLFGFQLVMASSVPLVPRIIGIIGVASSATALLYEFKVLKHKQLATFNPTGKDIFGRDLKTNVENKDFADSENSSEDSDGDSQK